MKTTLLLLTLFVLQTIFAQQWNYPETPKIPVYDTIFGKVYKDDYRWMENTKDPQFIDWLKAQKAFTDSVMALIPGQTELAEELRTSFSHWVDFYNVQKTGDTWIYRKLNPNDNSKTDAYIRKGLNGKEELWISMNEVVDSKNLSFSGFVPFPSGNLVMLDISQKGTEIRHPKFAELASGKLLTDSISGLFMNPVEIDGLPYVIYHKPATHDVRDINFINTLKLSLYKIGSKEESKVLFDIKDYPELNQEDFHFVQVHTTAYSDYIFLIYFNGVSSEIKTYFAHNKDLLKSNFRWKPINTPFIIPTEGRKFYLKNDRFFYHTLEANPAGELRMARFSQPEKKDTEVLFTPPEGWVIHNIAMTADDILITTTKNSVQSKVYQYNIDGGKVTPLNLAENGLISIRAFEDEAIINRSKWTEPNEIQLLNTKSGKFVKEFFISSKNNNTASNLVVEEVEARSHDGAMVPLSIIYNKTRVKKDGSNPVNLYGYGSFGYITSPGYMEFLKPILKRGLIFAVAHVRGGGEKGGDWHKAAVLEKKPNSWKDLHACAEYLIENGYTSKGKITATGASAGGILVGRAVTDRPDLYTAAEIKVGLMNTMRMEFTPNGISGVKEFGTLTIKEQVSSLYEMDSYHQTRYGEKYPGQYVEAGYEDPRVIIWQPAKYVAAMQAANQSNRPILFKVNMEGGHFGNSGNDTYKDLAEVFAFLFWQLGHPDFQP